MGRGEIKKAEQERRGKRGTAREAGQGWGRAKPAGAGRRRVGRSGVPNFEYTVHTKGPV